MGDAFYSRLMVLRRRLARRLPILKMVCSLCCFRPLHTYLRNPDAVQSWTEFEEGGVRLLHALLLSSICWRKPTDQGLW